MKPQDKDTSRKIKVYAQLSDGDDGYRIDSLTMSRDELFRDYKEELKEYGVDEEYIKELTETDEEHPFMFCGYEYEKLYGDSSCVGMSIWFENHEVMVKK